jgi:hypothetical protein
MLGLGQVREHAEHAGDLRGQAAALYRLALLAMAKFQFDVALEQALQSYLLSRDAKQYLAGAQTLTKLFEFLARIGFDSFAEKPALDLLSQAVMSMSEQTDDARLLAAQTLRAVAPLNGETRTTILRGISECFGTEVGEFLEAELDPMVALVRNSG